MRVTHLYENRYRLKSTACPATTTPTSRLQPYSQRCLPAHRPVLRNGFELTASHLSLSLADAATGDVFTVTRVIAPAATPEWALQLEDIGFLSGERVAIMARGMPGGDPLVVRVGLSTFALRLDEAACVQVAPVAAGAAA